MAASSAKQEFSPRVSFARRLRQVSKIYRSHVKLRAVQNNHY